MYLDTELNKIAQVSQFINYQQFQYEISRESRHRITSITATRSRRCMNGIKTGTCSLEWALKKTTDITSPGTGIVLAIQIAICTCVQRQIVEASTAVHVSDTSRSRTAESITMVRINIIKKTLKQSNYWAHCKIWKCIDTHNRI